MLNRVTLIGKVCEDIHIGWCPSGVVSISFSVSTKETYAEKDGKIFKSNEEHRIVSQGKVLEYWSWALRAGRPVLIDGRLQHTYSNGENQEQIIESSVFTDRIKFLDTGGDLTNNDGIDSEYEEPAIEHDEYDLSGIDDEGFPEDWEAEWE